MTGRSLIWTGSTVTVVAVVGLAAYWGRAGFRLADALGWIGAVVGIAGLALAVYGTADARRRTGSGSRPASPPGEDRPGSSPGDRPASSPGARAVTITGPVSGIVSTGDDTTNVQMTDRPADRTNPRS